jgi:TRAP-type uncharacterized transport system substrate-binding protein
MARRRRRRSHLSWGVIAWLTALAVIGLVAAAYNFAQVTYRVATGSEGGEAHRLFGAIAPVFTAESSIIRLSNMPTADMEASAKALESGKADLAIIRPDLTVPANGRTIVILRREPVLLIAPANLKIERVSDLAGKAIGMVSGAGDNAAILDTILNYYAVPQDAVQRVKLDPNQVEAAITQRRVAAVFLVAAVGRPITLDVVAAVARAGKGAPEFLAAEEAEGIANRFPTLDKLEIARGALQGNPAVPDKSITTLAISWRLAARGSLYDWSAGEISRLLVTNQSKVAATFPFAQVEAPDTSKDLVLSAHSGTVAYVDGEQTSIYDRFESLFWMGWMLCTLLGVSYAAIRSRINRHRNDATTEAIDRVLEMLPEVRNADANGLKSLEDEADGIIEWSLQARADDAIDEERFRLLSRALDHVRDAIDRQREVPRKRTLKAARG